MLHGQAAGPAVKAVEPYEGGPMAGQVYKLGFGNGSLIDHGDGTASYRNITPEFRVTIADITGFSYTLGRRHSTPGPEDPGPWHRAGIRLRR